MYVEDVDFYIIPDVEAAKAGSHYPYNIGFLDREVKVYSVSFNEDDGFTDDEAKVLSINMDYIKGDPFTDEEREKFGDLVVQLIIQVAHGLPRAEAPAEDI